MSEYKRLTSGNFNGAQCEYYDYYIDGCRIGNFILKCKECAHKERYDRLKEFEDKKESGLLVELPFIVVDRQTQKEADIYEIALKEDWAKDLCYCDMEGFAITQDGNLILLDECGKFVYCPYDRFEMIAEARFNELQEKRK